VQQVTRKGKKQQYRNRKEKSARGKKIRGHEALLWTIRVDAGNKEAKKVPWRSPQTRARRKN